MEAPDIQKEKSYQEYLSLLFHKLNLLKDQSLENRDELYKQLATVEDALETVLNWIKIEKSGLRNFETILEWSEILAKEAKIDTDEIRYRLRVVLQPQVEAFTLNLATCEKSALKVLDVVTKDLENLPTTLKGFQQKNFELLSKLGYEPESKTSHLDLALINLYSGRFADFKKEINALGVNDSPTEISKVNETENLENNN